MSDRAVPDDLVPDEAFWRPAPRHPMLRSRLAAAMSITVAALVVVTAVGLVVLWPRERATRTADFGPTRTFGAVVTGVDGVRCPGPAAAACRRVSVRLGDGPAKGTTSSFRVPVAPGSVALSRGDRIRVYRSVLPPGAVAAAPGVDRYSFSDFDRRGPILWLAIAFVTLLLLTGRLHGLRALLGLIASLVIVVEFVIPAILDGRAPLLVAVVGAFAVLLVTMPLSYGLGAKTLSALLGTASSLLLAAGLADVFAHLAHLSGLSSDESLYLAGARSSLSLQGLLVAGMVIGALGVLVDLTVSQASTVVALRRANPALGYTGLLRGAIDVGHDHIAATVNTLVFAYAGASLPVLLIFTIGGTPFTDAINGEAVAEEVIAALVGSIGLIASMPITTALAALLARRMEDSELDEAHAGSVHAHA
jgi:uncharacterized membrane protein